MKNRPGTNNVKNKPGTINEPGAWRFAAPSPTALSGESPEALFGRAAGLHQSGQLDLAEPLYRELLALQPENGDALHLLGVLLYQQRDPAAAVRLIEAALQFIPGNIFAWVGLGLALLRLNRFEEALNSFDRALEIKPDYAEALSKRGEALQGLGRQKEAVAAYNRSLRYRPDHAETLNNRAAALIDLGRTGEALACLDEALTLSPAYIEALNNRATALNALKRYAEALSTCDKALAIQPSVGQLHNNRGAALRNLGRREEAVVAFRAALLEQPDAAEIHANLGVTLQELGQAESAEPHLRQALAGKPCAVTFQSLGIVLYQLKKHSEATALYQEWVDLEPDNPIALHMLAAGRNSIPAQEEWASPGNSEPSTTEQSVLLTSYERALADNPNDADALYNHGLTLHRLGRPEAALASYDRALAIHPDFPQALNYRGIALCKLKKPQEGLISFRRALELQPDSAEYQTNKGRALLDLGQGEQGVEQLRQALTAEPSTAGFKALTFGLQRLGRIDEMTAVYQQWLAFEPDNPIPRHMAAAGSRAIPERAANQYVAELFDGFAENFDSTLLGLGYRTPQVLATMIQAELGDDATELRILDAGCGTGLAAALLKPLGRQLVGVDLSPKMLEKARERKLYDELVVAELCTFMTSRPAAFDLIILADTLVYFGALEEAFNAAHRALAPDGIFSFAVEARPADVTGPDYRLEPHGRYSHHPDYVTQLLTASGFTLRKIDDVVLRRELNADVAGIAVVARRDTT